MKINMMSIVTGMVSEYWKMVDHIDDAEDFQTAKQLGERAYGFLTAISTMTNEMICTENNDFTADMSELEDNMAASLYDMMVSVAIKFGDNNKAFEYAKRRDEYRQ